MLPSTQGFSEQLVSASTDQNFGEEIGFKEGK
jgi:hypothetical protein